MTKEKVQDKQKAGQTKAEANAKLEKVLWEAADALRKNLDAAEYKHIVLGLVFLKYISDTFEEKYRQIKAEGDNPEDKDEYTAENIFWVPIGARWSDIQKQARSIEIGGILNDAMDAIEKSNPELKNILHKDYSKSDVPSDTLGKLIDKFSDIELANGDTETTDTLGKVYEYFLG